MADKEDKKDDKKKRKSLAEQVEKSDDAKALDEWKGVFSATGEAVSTGAKATKETLAETMSKVPTPAENMKKMFGKQKPKRSKEYYESEPVSKEELASFEEPDPFKTGDFRPTPSAKATPEIKADEASFKPGRLSGLTNDEDYKKFRASLSRVESADNPSARNPESSAKGLFQFTDRWDPYFQKKFGKTYSDTIPPEGASLAERTKAAEQQTFMFDHYYQDQIVPFIKKVRADGHGKDRSDVEIAALFHHHGGPDAQKFLATGEDTARDGIGAGAYMDSVAVGGKFTPRSRKGDEAGPASLREVTSTADEEVPPPEDVDKTTLAARTRLANARTDRGFEREMKKNKEDYAAERENLSLREAIESVANGLGKIGAGYAGLRTGTDMSSVKFDKQDWDRKRGLAQDDHKINVGDLSDRRKEHINQTQHGDRMSMDQQQLDATTKNQKGQLDHQGNALKETTRHNKAMEALGGSKITAAGATARQKLSGAQAKAYTKSVEEVSNDLYTISKDMERDGVSEEDASARIQTMLQTKLKLSPQQAKEIVVDEGFFTDSMHDLSAIQTKVSEIAQSQLVIQELRGQLNEGEVLVIDPEGNPHATTLAESAAFQKQPGYRVIQ